MARKQADISQTVSRKRKIGLAGTVVAAAALLTGCPIKSTGGHRPSYQDDVQYRIDTNNYRSRNPYADRPNYSDPRF